MPTLKISGLFVALSSCAAYASDCEYLASPPDAEIASGSNGSSAWYGGATTRYRHGVLGDSIEATTLYVKGKESDPCAMSLTLSDESVFEDVTPRIADVTGDGRDNIITIESHRDVGASLAIYGIVDGALVKLTATPYIGTRNRWLAPIGTADFNDDGIQDVALVQTPHLAGVIQIWSFASTEPALLASRGGFSNHRIGENFITGGVALCEGRPRLVVPDISWSQTMIVEFNNQSLSAMAVADDTTAASINTYLQCEK